MKKEILNILKFYSNPKNYEFDGGIYSEYNNKIEKDGGRKARLALRKYVAKI
jgi:hypothetical protein